MTRTLFKLFSAGSCAAWAASLLLIATPGCGDAEGADDAERPASPGAAERHLAEEVSALLPGLWRQEGEAGGEVEITLLGQDAVSGDLALLVEDRRSGAVHPARVLIFETQAVVEYTEDSAAWSIDVLEEDRLVLVPSDGASRQRYQRAR